MKSITTSKVSEGSGDIPFKKISQQQVQ